MSFPVHDWQFWVVTALAAGAAWMVLRHLLPFGKRRKGKGQRTSLTIGGQAVDGPHASKQPRKGQNG